ncbi:hypothetical protein ABZ297_08845, partial [Nonomuraea sp. NPDC005983]|uniref:hypothetical protein n=1 Tax=Nonomuraea sp. NPDC005983 TaxID=3155595 RepID=UPI0033AF3B66
TGELRELLELRALPEVRWGPDGSEPGVHAYVQAALTSQDGVTRLLGLAERARRPEFLRSVGELADAAGREPWREGPRPLVRTLVHRRHASVPRVDWLALLADEPLRRRREGPLPRSAARLMALRADTPGELLRLVIIDHPELAPLIPSPSPELLADVCERLTLVGGQAVVKVAGNGFIAGTLTVEEIVAIVPPEVLDLLAESLWLPGLRCTAAVRTLLGRDGDVRLRPFFTDETGHGPRRRLRSPGQPMHWDPAVVYGQRVLAALRQRGDEGLSADEVLSMVSPDAVLAPGSGALPDPRVLLRLAELVHRHLGSRPEAWMVALKLLQDGFVGTLPELLITAGAVAA